MERFIDGSTSAGLVIYDKFKIQYGEIYSTEASPSSSTLS